MNDAHDRRPTLVVLCETEESLPPQMMVDQLVATRYTTERDLAEALVGAQALFMWDFLSTSLQDAWTSADSLQWVHIASAGVDRLIFPGLVESDVTVTNSRGVFDRPIAEYVLAMILAVAKDVPSTVRLQADKVWRHRETRLISGLRVVVIGTGSIGRAIGSMLRNSGMRVEMVGRVGVLDEEFGAVHGADDLAEVVHDADFVVIAAPLTQSTAGLVDQAVLSAMSPNTWVVNVGRGAIIDEGALIQALQDRRLGGAVLDVVRSEPLPADSPLWTMPNVIVSPHMSGDVRGWQDALVEVFENNLRAWLQGAPLVNVVDKQAGYVRGRTPSQEVRPRASSPAAP